MAKERTTHGGPRESEPRTGSLESSRQSLPPGEQSIVKVLAEALQTSQFRTEYASLPDGERADLFFALGRFMQQTRQEHGPFWPKNQPASAIRRYRQRGYLQAKELESAQLSPAAITLLEEYRRNLVTHGDEGIAHLCLSKRAFTLLTRNGIERLGDAERLLEPSHPLSYIVWGYGTRYPSLGVEIRQKLDDLRKDRQTGGPKDAGENAPPERQRDIGSDLPVDK
jgi:hypothetical protein